MDLISVLMSRAVVRLSKPLGAKWHKIRERVNMADLVRQLFREHSWTRSARFCADPRLRSLASTALKDKDTEPLYEPDKALNSSLGVMITLTLAGRLEAIGAVDGFWRVYRRILARRVSAACDRHDALKRGGEGIRKPRSSRLPPGLPTPSYRAAQRAADPPDDFNLFRCGLPSVEVTVIGREVTQLLTALLEPDHQKIVGMRVDGYTIAQMATALDVSPRPPSIGCWRRFGTLGSRATCSTDQCQGDVCVVRASSVARLG